MAFPEFPNRLDTPIPQGGRLATRFCLLATLLVICLVPRGLMALRVPSVDPDGVLYIELAKTLDAGDLRRGTDGMGLNTYPVILMLLHRAGLDWELAGVVWGVVIASLVVLPLYGWVRRQFDDRVAATACLLYAVHPKMIEWSPELTRDPTFWFLLVLTLYLLWRAVTEVRLRWFLAAGPALILALLTRFEALVLLFPLVLWSFWRWLALRTARTRLALGVVLCLATVPILTLLMVSCWLRVPWDSLHLRLDPWARFQTWLEYATGDMAAAQAGLNPLLPADVEPMPLRIMLREFVATMTRGLSPIYALLMFGGLWAWRSTWARRDHQPLFYAALGVLAGIWVHLWYDRMICPRYALSIALMASPFAALALLGLTQRMARTAEGVCHCLTAAGSTSSEGEDGVSAAVKQCCTGKVGAVRQPTLLSSAMAAAPIVVVAAIGIASAMTSNRCYFASRKLAVDLGRWVQQAPWTAPMMVGPAGLTPIMGFYAEKGRYELFRNDTADAAEIAGLVQRYHPDLLLLRPTKRMNALRCEELASQLKLQGFTEVDPVPRPAGSDPVVLLVRGHAGVRVAGRTAR